MMKKLEALNLSMRRKFKIKKEFLNLFLPKLVKIFSLENLFLTSVCQLIFFVHKVIYKDWSTV